MDAITFAIMDEAAQVFLDSLEDDPWYEPEEIDDLWDGDPFTGEPAGVEWCLELERHEKWLDLREQDEDELLTHAIECLRRKRAAVSATPPGNVVEFKRRA